MMKIADLLHKRLETPTILQMEATECGAACLTMILGYYGLWLPLEKVREECGVSRDGASAANILKAARHYGLNAQGKRYSVERLKEVNLPLIIHWEFQHFVVLEAVDEEFAYLNDPGMGHRRVPWKDFRESYTGIAITFTPGETFQKGGEAYSVVKAVASLLLRDKQAFQFLTIISLCLVLPQLALPAVKATFMDNILGWRYESWLVPLLWFASGMVVLMLLLTWMRLRGMTKWLEKLTIADSSRFFWHLLRLPFSFYQQRSPNEVVSRVSFNQSVAQVLTGQAATAGFDLVMTGFYFLVMLCYNVKLAFMGAFVAGVNILGFLYVRKKLLEMIMQAQMEVGKAYGAAVNGLMMIESIKANGTEDEFFERIMGYNTKGFAAHHKVTVFNVFLEFLPLFTSGISVTMVMSLGGYSVMDGLMTLGIYMAFQSMLDAFYVPLQNLLMVGSSLQETEMQLKRLDDVMHYPEDELNFPPATADRVEQMRLQGRVEIKNLVFGYSKLSAPLLDDFNLNLPAGSWVALVGGSGCGKSTIARLLTGIYEEWSGEILFDGYSRKRFSRQAICVSLGVVEQDAYLFNASIEENITLFDKSIPHEDVVQAAKDACIYDDIMNLEGGFGYLVAEAGANFSGGQRQRLEIARALAINPSVLILDEATSALDPVTEKNVMDNIRRRGCSCVVIAHRLSTIRDCDEIIVLDHGKVLERGRHEELLSRGGAYAGLIADQTPGKAVGV